MAGEQLRENTRYGHHILIGICEVEELPSIPEIRKRQWVNYSIPPTPRNEDAS
jgi:hypothetical protein